jgi:glycosyltransferase involved in cell wall biosynthesis
LSTAAASATPKKGVLLLPEIIRRVAGSGVGVRFEVLGDGPDREEFVRLIQGKKVKVPNQKKVSKKGVKKRVDGSPRGR